MKTRKQIIYLLLLFLLSTSFLMLTGCFDKQLNKAVYQPKVASDSPLPDYMQEEINKDYETIEKSDTDEDEVMPLTHLQSSDDLFKSMQKDKDSDTITINEKVFITQINDIYLNFEDYKNKTIIVEGMYSVFESTVSDAVSPVVYRNGPGCCNNDGWAGFLLKYDGKLPKENDWIKVTGTPFLDNTEHGYTNLYLDVVSIEVLEKRGAELVAQ